jgi:nucleoside-specific outer membrane channel protein Tsx
LGLVMRFLMTCVMLALSVVVAGSAEVVATRCQREDVHSTARHSADTGRCASH